MVRRISHWLYRISGGWVALLALVIFLGFSGLVLPAQSQAAAQYSGEVSSPDTSFFYGADNLYAFAEAAGEAGRQAYIRARFTFDLLWPLVYTFFLATAISWVFSKSFPESSRWRIANLLPLLGMTFDYLENIGAALVIGRYPSQTPVLDLLTPIFTMLKWGFILASFLALISGFFVGIWVWLRSRSRPAQ